MMQSRLSPSRPLVRRRSSVRGKAVADGSSSSRPVSRPAASITAAVAAIGTLGACSGSVTTPSGAQLNVPMLLFLILFALVLIYVLLRRHGQQQPEPYHDPEPDDTSGDEILRFVDVRAPDLPYFVDRGAFGTAHAAYARRTGSSGYVERLREADAAGSIREIVEARRAASAEYRESAEFIDSIDAVREVHTPADRFLSWVERDEQAATPDRLREKLRDIAKIHSVQEYLASESYRTTYGRVWDSYTALALSPPPEQALRRALGRILRFYGILQRLVDADAPGAALTGRSAIRHAAGARLLLPIAALPRAAGAVPIQARSGGEATVPTEPMPDRGIVGYVNVLGVGDLRLVRQQIDRYEPTEIAHIENVMATEKRERTHTRTEREEERVLTETETAEEEERDLETSERYELQKESERTAQTDLQLQAGANVTATYGFVTVNATTNFAYSDSSTRADRNASEFAKDIVDRSVKKIQERVLKVREKKTMREIIESNLHAFDNTGGRRHVIGIYRWLTKVYKAKLVNYGRRLMVEVLVPEPASHYRYATRTAEQRALAELDPPLAPNDPARADDPDALPPLADPRDLTHDNYLEWAAEYGVEGVEPYPPEEVSIMSTAKAELTGSGDPVVTLEDLVVPEGYKAVEWRFRGRINVHTNWEDDAWRVTVVIGSKPHAHYRENLTFVAAIGSVDWEFGDTAFRTLWNPGEPVITGKVPVTVVGDLVQNFQLNVEIKCTPLDDPPFVDWRTRTYEKILEAYNLRRAEYEERLARLRSAAASDALGRNPLANREIERLELKRAAISIFTERHLGTDVADDPDTGEPDVHTLESEAGDIDFAPAARRGRYAQFFEQAFEWDNVAYSFYPYFWAEREHWSDLFDADDADPLFQNFLKAGYARVVVPVRPAYDTAVLNYFYLHPDDPWGADGPPVIDADYDGVDDDLYVPIADELARPAPERLVVPPWEVRLPTDLILLQQGESLAGVPPER